MRKYIIWLIVFAILEISLALFLTHWRENFWNSVSNKEPLQFIQQLEIFTCVALVICFVSGISGYLVSLSAIKWREILNHRAHQRVLSKAFKDVENISQRIQEDCTTYPDLFLNLAFGTVKAITYILVFSISLILSFEWWYLGILLSYTIIGSVFTNYIAKPLIHLNYENQRAEASYRRGLDSQLASREGIAISNFQDCIYIMLGLARKQKHLTYFQQFYGQVGVVLPLIIIAPVYFTTGMTIGSLMRFNSVSSTILENCSYGINSFAMINRLISCRKRLREAKIL